MDTVEPNPIIKKNTNFTVMSNISLKDIRLSFKAKGIYVYLLSLPDNWKWHLSESKIQATDNRYSISSGVNELIKYGYIEMVQCRDSKGNFIEYNIRRII